MVNFSEREYPIQFVAPYPAGKAAGMLAQQHEKSRFFAWDWQYRNVVNVTEDPDGTYRFRLRRMPRSFMEGFYYVIEIRGVLAPLDAGRSQVVAKAQIPLGWSLLSLLAILGFAALAVFLVVTEPQFAGWAGVVYLAIPVVMALSWVAMIWWQRRRLENLLRNTLSGEAFWSPPPTRSLDDR